MRETLGRMMMQRWSGWFIVLSVLMLCVRSTVAEAKAPGLHVDAKAAVLMDADSGQTLFEQDSNLVQELPGVSRVAIDATPETATLIGEADK